MAKKKRKPQRWKYEKGAVLADHNGWKLHWRPVKGEWHNFVLVAPRMKGQRKRKFHGAHNGLRLTGSGDLAVLQKHYREIYDWLKGALAIYD